LIFIDNDILVTPDFIRRHLEILDSHPNCWVIGRIVHPPELRQTPFGRYRDDMWEAFQKQHEAGCVSETVGMTAANLALPAADFARLGGFDEGFSIASCEDWDLAWRARATGIRILYDASNVVLHNDWAVSLHHFCERQRLYSISDVLLWRKYGGRTPRARLVCDNAPIQWTSDSPWLVLRKVVKHLLATRIGRATLRRVCSIAERALPDSRLSRRAYQVAVGVAIFQGVREGLRRYGEASAVSEGELVGHGDTKGARGRRP